MYFLALDIDCVHSCHERVERKAARSIMMSMMTRLVRFSLMLLLAIPSTFCSIYIIYIAIRFSLLRRYFYYEILILLSFLILLEVLFSVSITLSFYARGAVWPATKAFCRYWSWADYTSSCCIIWCQAIFTIERYLLVFHPHQLRSRRQKILLHYLPLVLTNTYLIIFYTCIFLIMPCETEQDYTYYMCGEICIDSQPALSMFNWLFNVLLPVFVVIFGSLVLLVRVLWTRRKMQRNLKNWSKNWKMIVQLLGIAIVYSVVWLPLSIVSLISNSSENLDFHVILDHYIYQLTYIADMSVPILTMVFSPEINRYLCPRRRVHSMAVNSMVSKDTAGY